MIPETDRSGFTIYMLIPAISGLIVGACAGVWIGLQFLSGLACH